MRVTALLSIVAAAALVTASPVKEHHTPKGRSAPTGKAFDHFLQIWLENQVHYSLLILLLSKSHLCLVVCVGF